MRPMFLSTEEKLRIAQIAQKQIGQTFVLASKDQPHLYCTTLLAESIQQIHPDFQPRWQHLDIPLFRGEYLFPQAFASYTDTKTVYIINHKP
ncbi:hypothetical protein [Snodgrassella sp. CFCC 13594]|uniref:hypothetical protein n=1 Tax=Snodgrassella sp. CFCC 13594 TaxID=1775559 RepID=UPI000B28495B|nr:hypothetical protein [Snodgrassella sp. CFCC 13594]